jgi:hypothetical protein
MHASEEILAVHPVVLNICGRDRRGAVVVIFVRWNVCELGLFAGDERGARTVHGLMIIEHHLDGGRRANPDPCVVEFPCDLWRAVDAYPLARVARLATHCGQQSSRKGKKTADSSRAQTCNLEGLRGSVYRNDETWAQLVCLLAVVRSVRGQRREIHLVTVGVAPQDESRVELRCTLKWLEHSYEMSRMRRRDKEDANLVLHRARFIPWLRRPYVTESRNVEGGDQ